MTDQPSLFEKAGVGYGWGGSVVGQVQMFEPARAHARKTDPYTSDKALKAIAKDKSLMNWIWFAATRYRDTGEVFNDTMLTQFLEQLIGERQQRNVIARSRGLLVQAGMLRAVGVAVYEGRELVHYQIDPNNPKEKQCQGSVSQ